MMLLRHRLIPVAVVSDNWWGDNPPSHTLLNHFRGISVTAEVSYAGALACVTFPNATDPTAHRGVGMSNDASTRVPLPWFELRTAASGTAACAHNADCEL
eukprot:COSAG02_NODE_4119_length_5750_cov_1.948151_5_plen_100_part_00